MILKDLLPIRPPSEFDPGPSYFYENVVKHLIPDMVKLMNTGLHIDSNEVDKLRSTLDDILQTVVDRLASNSIIKTYQKSRLKEHKKEVTDTLRTIDDYIVPYNEKSAVHRVYIVNRRLRELGQEELIKSKWNLTDIKKMNLYLEDSLLTKLLDKTITQEEASPGMRDMAQSKLDVWNIPRIKSMATIPAFNPGSSKQVSGLFASIGIEPLAFSKDTGEPSWGRGQIEEVLETATDIDLIDLLEAFIDYSFGNIVRTTFVEGFDKFSINNVLRGNFKLFGAKTFRPTSNSINLLNMPSTKSIYAKPLKKCIVAPPGYLIWTIDYSALEDRVIANLSGDINKQNIFLEGLDGHSLNAVGYFPDKVAKILGPNTDNVAYVRKFMAEVDAGNKEIKALRQEGKGPTFGLAYGAFPKKIAATIKCSIEDATKIFDNYHEVLYPGITSFREDIILPQAKRDGYIHMGLGCRMYVDDVDKDARTVFNSASQFWSILTLISLHRLNNEIVATKKEEDIQANATIYDAIYGLVKADAESIKWLNDTICPIMEKDFLEDQVVHNSANLEIGSNWAELTELQHSVTIQQIQEVIDEI
jgi:hypothetical protein